jgi:tetratricopeptide (TPR) repeat protein
MLRCTIIILLSLMLLFACTPSSEKPNELEPEYGQLTGIPSIDAISRDIQNDPNNLTLYVARCEAYSAEGMLKEAEEEARQLWERDKTNWKSARLLAWAYFDNNKSKPAIKVLDQTLEIHPDTLHLLLLHAHMNMLVEQYDKALISAEKVLKLSPMNIEGLFMRGLTLKYTGDTIGAMNNFQTAIELEADYSDAYMQLAIIFSEKKEKIAIQYFDNALRIDSTSYEALFGKAQFYHQNYTLANKMLDKAKKAYEQTILNHPQQSEASYNYAMLYMEEKDFEQAHHFFDVATKYDPTFGDAYYYKGLASEKLGNLEAALNDYKNAVSNNERFGWAADAIERLKYQMAG